MQLFLNRSLLTSFYASITKKKVELVPVLGTGTLSGRARLQSTWAGHTDYYFSLPEHRQRVTRFFHTSTSSVMLNVSARNLGIDVYIDGVLQHSYTRVDVQMDAIALTVGVGNHVISLLFTHTGVTTAEPYFSLSVDDNNLVEVLPASVPQLLPDSAVFCQEDLHDRIGNTPISDEDKFTLSIYSGTIPTVTTIKTVMSDNVSRASVFGELGWQTNGLSSVPALIHEHSSTLSLIKHIVDTDGHIVGLRMGLESLYKIVASNSGAATWFVLALSLGAIYQTKGYSVVGTVGVIGSGADLEIPNTNIVAGNQYIIANLRLPLSRHYV